MSARGSFDVLRKSAGSITLVDGVVLGYTEIPLLLGDEAEATDLVRPLALLAEAAVRLAIRDAAG